MQQVAANDATQAVEARVIESAISAHANVYDVVFSGAEGRVVIHCVDERSANEVAGLLNDDDRVCGATIAPLGCEACVEGGGSVVAAAVAAIAMVAIAAFCAGVLVNKWTSAERPAAVRSVLI